MASLGMQGAYDLTIEEIDKRVTRKSCGNYALGKVSDNTFNVSYVGRSDKDVGGRLKKWVGKYKKFKFSYASSPKAAFEKECGNYHDFDPPGNDVHPARPDDTNWKCPRCDIYG